jgi:hypothetical protein
VAQTEGRSSGYRCYRVAEPWGEGFLTACVDGLKGWSRPKGDITDLVGRVGEILEAMEPAILIRTNRLGRKEPNNDHYRSRFHIGVDSTPSFSKSLWSIRTALSTEKRRWDRLLYKEFETVRAGSEC